MERLEVEKPPGVSRATTTGSHKTKSVYPERKVKVQTPPPASSALCERGSQSLSRESLFGSGLLLDTPALYNKAATWVVCLKSTILAKMCYK